MNYSVIIPVLEPDTKTTTFIKTLLDAGFKSIIVVDDGSSEKSRIYFEEIRKHPECEVLVHDVNKGKGAALKTAFRHLFTNRPDIDAAITADGDGQHTVSCIKACINEHEKNKEAVIFGGRSFNNKEIPFRSRFGNKLSAIVYRFACGIDLEDTQTGLRIIPAAYFEEFSKLKGDRYEYETNMILAVANGKIPYKEAPIETIYIDDNASSHFNPIKDSVKIYITILKSVFAFLLNSGISWVVDEGLFWLLKDAVLMGAIGAADVRSSVSIVLARIISSALNFTLNRKTVFGSKGKIAGAVVRYYILAACMLAVSLCLVNVFAHRILHIGGFLEVILKCVVDILLFVISYTVQRKWVFKDKEA